MLTTHKFVDHKGDPFLLENVTQVKIQSLFSRHDSPLSRMAQSASKDMTSSHGVSSKPTSPQNENKQYL